jgi:hypothetical protein
MNMVEIDQLYNKRAIVASVILHLIIMLVKIDYEPIRVEMRKDAIEVQMMSPEEIQKIIKKQEKPIKQPIVEKSEIKKPEVLKEKPKEKLVVGTQKIVPKAKELGNPNAKKVQDVQKGDPMSKDFSKYKPDTDFQKLKATNIGSGSLGDKFKTNNPGGSGDTYKGTDFAVKSLTNNAGLGSRFKVKNAADGLGAGFGSTGGINAGSSSGAGDGTITGTRTGTLEKAKILTNVGSLTGATVGRIDSSKGAEGLGKKGTILLSGEPEDTVILGSMDPDLIRRKLLEHLAEFRYCYQQELDAADNAASGVLLLLFKIGGTGSVTSANVQGPPHITPKVKTCMSGVLRGIQFPPPKGGGTVEVKQPLNLYPRQL